MTTIAPPPPKVFEWTPNPKQLEVLQAIAECPEDEYVFIGYGGAAAGGKTNLLANGPLDIALQCPGSRQLVCRKEFVHLKTTTLAEFDKFCPPALLAKTYDSSPVSRWVRDPSWDADTPSSEIVFMGCDHAKERIGSEEFSFIWVEEAQEVAEADLLYLWSRCRHKPERKWGMVCTFNPFPSAVTNWFMLGQDLPDEMKAEDGLVHMRFIQSFASDNPHNPKNYAAMLAVRYAGDPYLRAVMLEGRAEAVPNAVFGMLYDPEVAKALQTWAVRPEVELRRGIEGNDWGTTKQHKSAKVFGAVDQHGELWVLDAWESPLGSSDELLQVSTSWRSDYLRPNGRPLLTTAVYDRSQGSLADPLMKIFGESFVFPGVRDVDGRIREALGLIGRGRVHFLMSSAGVRRLWHYLTMYHRDDDGEIVEEQDDMVDAFLYMTYEAMNPSLKATGEVRTTGVSYAPKQGAVPPNPFFPNRVPAPKPREKRAGI